MRANIPSTTPRKPRMPAANAATLLEEPGHDLESIDAARAAAMGRRSPGLRENYKTAARLLEAVYMLPSEPSDARYSSGACSRSKVATCPCPVSANKLRSNNQTQSNKRWQTARSKPKQVVCFPPITAKGPAPDKTAFTKPSTDITHGSGTCPGCVANNTNTMFAKHES